MEQIDEYIYQIGDLVVITLPSYGMVISGIIFDITLVFDSNKATIVSVLIKNLEQRLSFLWKPIRDGGSIKLIATKANILALGGKG